MKTNYEKFVSKLKRYIKKSFGDSFVFHEIKINKDTGISHLLIRFPFKDVISLENMCAGWHFQCKNDQEREDLCTRYDDITGTMMDFYMKKQLELAVVNLFQGTETYKENHETKA
jgi:hypothetical protein